MGRQRERQEGVERGCGVDSKWDKNGKKGNKIQGTITDASIT